MVKLKVLIEKEKLAKAVKKGNLACPGCNLNLAFRHAMAALENNAIIVVPACCTSVIQGFGHGYGLNIPIFNCAFASSAAVASGMARMMKRRDPNVNIVVWAGDGGTADIGFATLSGAAERDEDIIYVMYDNEGYQNTGAQKSGSTPRGAKTTTTVTGKRSPKKSVAKMMVAQGVPYVATASAVYPLDLYDKIYRAAHEFKGHFRFIQIHTPCPPGWQVQTQDVVKVGKLSVETGYWILYEAVHGKVTISSKSRRYQDPAKRAPIEEWMKYQGRFKNITPELVKQLEEDIQFEWEEILKLTQ